MSAGSAMGIGNGDDLVPVVALSLWGRARKLASEKLSYALADQITYSFGNMVVLALVSRRDPGEFGAYILTQRAMDVIFQLSNVFLWAPYTYNLPGMQRERQREYLGSVLLLQVFGCIAAALLVAAAAAWAYSDSQTLYYSVFASLVLTSGGIAFRECTRRMYFAEMRFREAFWADAATVGLQIGGCGVVVRRAQADTHGDPVDAGDGEHRRFVMVVRSRAAELSASPGGDEWRSAPEHEAGAMVPRQQHGVSMVSAQCNPWVLSAIRGGNSVGMYAVCESVLNIPRVALNSLQNVMAPMMARAFAQGGKARLSALITRLDRMLLIGSAGCAVFVVILGPSVARVIFHSTPDHVRWILAALACNLVAFAGTLARSFGLSSMNRAAQTFYAYLAGMVVQLAVLMPLVRHKGAPGAATAPAARDDRGRVQPGHFLLAGN